MKNSKPKSSPAQYLEANRLHREGYVPVSSKYRLARSVPLLPPDDQLLDLLKRVDRPTYENLKQSIVLALTRVLGKREEELDVGTYAALKDIERESLTGRVVTAHMAAGRPRPSKS
jgi:hypothetical protein